MDRDITVVDAHMHIGAFPMFGVDIDQRGLEALMTARSIDRGVVFAPNNRLILDAIEQSQVLFGLVWVNPRAEGHLEEMVELLDHPRFVGVKLHPLIDGYHPNDEIVQPIARYIAEEGYPALIHCGHPLFTLPWSIEELIVRNPEASIILGHMGHGNIIYVNGAIDVAERHPNVYLETSGMQSLPKIPEAVERVGPDKVLFGSDAPLHDPGLEKDKVKMSGLKPPELEAVLGRNAMTLFGIEQ